MKNYSNLVFCSHINSGNHGCEAIAKSTCEILEAKPDRTYFFSDDIELDKYCQINKIGHLVKIPQIIGYHPISSVLPRILRKSNIDKDALWKYKYNASMKFIKENSLVLVTGGDIYCYDQSDWLTFFNKESRKKGAITILWGCSIEKSRIDERVFQDLMRYSLITVRESLTYKNLQEFGITENVVIYPDPAFKLSTEPIEYFDWNKIGDAIGINLSLHIVKNEKCFNNFCGLIQYIIDTTELDIVLIPHVYWSNENDLEILKKIYEVFENSERLFIVEKELNCNQLKYLISRCKMYMGARTHSVIAAYSTCVPTVAFGYSVKSRGIARDIFGTEDNFVLTVNESTTKNDLIFAFKYLYNNQDKIRDYLNEKMPSYIAKIDGEKQYIENFMESHIT